VTRWKVVVAFGAAALVCAYGASVLADAIGLNPLVVAAGAFVFVAVFGYTRRDDDILDIAFPAFIIAYAAFLGMALARVPHTAVPSLTPSWALGPLGNIGSLGERWPFVLLAGVPFALILTVAAAVPGSLIPRRRRLDPHAHDSFWSAVAEQNAKQQAAPRPPGKPPE
jgi:hypothetical protein